MTHRHRPNGFRPQLEALEAREVPATPVQIGSTGITLSGSLSTWDYSDGGSFTPSPVFANIDEDVDEELITVTGDRDVAAYYSDGGTGFTLLRTFDTGTAAAEIFTTPLVLTIPGIGKAVFAGDRNGKLYGWNAATGAMLPGFPASVDVPNSLYPQGGERNSILGPLGAGDLDGDGVPEIVATSYNQHVTAFRSNGSMMWRYANDDSVLSGVAVGDLDRDGISEVVIGGDYSQNAIYDAGGNVTALSGPTGRRKWIKQLPQIGQSSPVLADIDNDGRLEIFTGSGVNFTNLNGVQFPGNAVYGIDSNGNDLAGWPYLTTAGNNNAEGRTPSPPALADLTGDGIPEIIVGDYDGKMHAIRANGTALWTSRVQFSNSDARFFAAPVVLDIDGDNDLDVVQVANGEVRAFNGATGASTWSGFIENGNERQFINSPAVGRFRGNGTVQLALLSNGSSAGGQPRSPSFVRLFDVDASTTTPQWWASRGDASANVVRRTAAFVNGYVNGLGTYLGRDAAGTTSLVNAWRAEFQTAQSLETLSRSIVVTNEGRSNEIRRWYTTYLNRPAAQSDIDAWLPSLAAGQRFAQVEANILGSPEAYFTSGGSNQAWVTYMYQKVLGRSPQNGEDTGWVNQINSGSVQRFQVSYGILQSQESTERRVRGWYTAFAFGGVTTAPAASLFAAAWDLRRERAEEQVLLRLFGNGRASNVSDYPSTITDGAWLKGIYKDLLKRDASQADLVSWMMQREAGQGLDTIARAIGNSVERNILLVKSYYRRYLQRSTDPTNGEVMGYATQLNNGSITREALVTSLLNSVEFAIISGGTTAGFVNKAWEVFFGAGRTPDTASFNFWVNNPNVKTQLPLNLLQQDEFLFNTIKNDWMITYLRRYPHTPSNQSALFTGSTPDPYAPVRGDINHMKAGTGRQLDIEVGYLVSAEYIFIARYTAFWTGKRWKI